MNEKDLPTAAGDETVERKFILENFRLSPISSGANQPREFAEIPENKLKFAADAETEDVAAPSEIFKQLADPQLPALPGENRARLQMQSPTRIFFYWSLKSNPFETMHRAFGSRADNFVLTAKLVNLSGGADEYFPVAPNGSRWFDVEADTKYQIEIGFFSANRLFVRLIVSNAITTPRTAPSPRFDASPQFAVSPQEFAEVLDASGFAQDAFDVALVGDDQAATDAATHRAFAQLTANDAANFSENHADELRLVLFALASGVALEGLRGHVSEKLFARLQEFLGSLTIERAAAAVEQHFGYDALGSDADEIEEFTLTAVGASRVNFHKFPKRLPHRFSPISS